MHLIDWLARRFVGLGSILVVALLTCSCTSITQPGSLLMDDDGLLAEPTDVPSVEKIAHEIDCLEKHIDKYGSIVPQHASVWGQSRLMMHRQEFERVMRMDIYSFASTLQATVATSDQAYLANSFGLQAGVAAATGAAAGVSSNVSDPKDVIQREMLLKGKAQNLIGPNGKLMIEPSLLEDQKKRFLDHLHELRRINEGDDNIDAPGYGLNLIRMPISVLPGSCTQTGFGAECTITATPHLSDELLPQTFRELVINDIVRLLTVPLTSVIETMDEPALSKNLSEFESAQASNTENVKEREKARQSAALYYAVTFSTPSSSSSRSLNQTPIPPSQIQWTFGANHLAYIAIALKKQVKDHLACKGSVYHLDVQATLKQELVAAYAFLASPCAQHLWEYCCLSLAQAIRTQDVRMLIKIQDEYQKSVKKLSTTTFTDPGTAIEHSLTSLLAWTIIIDSALLNERFLQDMKTAHVAKGCPCVPGEWPAFYLPHPPAPTCQFFNEYVQCRWPIYVFAIDPETEDQNVGDSFSLRRELQLAMSLAFTNGQMSASNFTRYVWDRARKQRQF